MKQKRTRSVIAVIILVIAAFIVPYTFLTHTTAWYGSFLFWVLFVFVMIGINIWISHRWEDTHEQ